MPEYHSNNKQRRHLFQSLLDTLTTKARLDGTLWKPPRGELSVLLFDRQAMVILSIPQGSLHVRRYREDVPTSTVESEPRLAYPSTHPTILNELHDGGLSKVKFSTPYRTCMRTTMLQ